GDVASYRERSLGSDAPRDGLGACGVTDVDDHRRAALVKPGSGRASQAACRTGDDRNAPGEIGPRGLRTRRCYQLEITTRRSGKKSIASVPCALRSQKNELREPPNGKNAIGAATPIFTPIMLMPARYRNSRAACPLVVKIDVALP